MADRVTVVGAGNGGAAAAAELSLAGYSVSLFNRSPGRIQRFLDQGGVSLVNESGRHGVVPVDRVTTDVAEALEDSLTVLVMVPTSGLGYYAAKLAPHLTSRHTVLLAPGHTGGALHFRNVVLREGGELPAVIGETNTLPYICRMTADGEVTVWRHSQALLTSALPASNTAALCEAAAALLTANQVVAARNVLETSLSNYNAVMHPAGMILNAGWIENPDKEFRYYAEGHGPAVGRVIAAVDSERVAVGKAYGLDLVPFLEAFYRSGYTTEEAARSGRVDVAIRESGPNREIMAPSSLEDRYVTEDIGFGLVPMIELGRVAGVATPATTALVDLAGVATGTDFFSSGLDAAGMGIESMNRRQLLEFVETGGR